MIIETDGFVGSLSDVLPGRHFHWSPTGSGGGGGWLGGGLHQPFSRLPQRRLSILAITRGTRTVLSLPLPVVEVREEHQRLVDTHLTLVQGRGEVHGGADVGRRH